MSEVSNKIRQVMAVVFDVDAKEIPENAEPGIIENWDSLRHMALIVALEEEFEISFTDEEMVELLNLSLITTIISEKLE
jgi:acyl carrier protein